MLIYVKIGAEEGAESAKPLGFHIQQTTISPHPHGNT